MPSLRLDSPDIGRLLLRLSLGLALLIHGLTKLILPAQLIAVAGLLQDVGLPTVLAYATLIAEIGGSLMILLGWRARLGGIVVAIDIGFAVALAYLPRALDLTPEGGWALELPAILFAVAMTIVALGSGRIALRPD
ncbi:DoxX family protein [Salinicola halophilus]|uniref:DoxX family protein n=1 Tax=Salinicola halophilus TaxID=184065 RepID=UPI000DA1B2C6|nr:DoxX family membrane protein [Salinicola halophilus]